MPQYQVTKVSYFGNKIRQVGDIINYDGLPGSNLKPVKGDKEAEKRKAEALKAVADRKKQRLVAKAGGDSSQAVLLMKVITDLRSELADVRKEMSTLKGESDEFVIADDHKDPEPEDDSDGEEGGEDDAPIEDRILDVLDGLDPADDAHWTKDGLPNVNVVTEALGEAVTRKQIDEVAPDFKRPEVD